MKTQFKFLQKLGLQNLHRVDDCVDLEEDDWESLICGKELGGIIALGFIKKGTDIGSTDEEIISFLQSEVSWSNGIGASPQTMWVLPRTRGNLPAGTATEADGYGLESTNFNGDDQDLTFEIQGTMANRNVVKMLNKYRGWGFVYVTAGYNSAQDGYEAFYAPNTSVYMRKVIEQNIKTEKRWQGNVKWSTDGTPSLPFYAPASIFVNQEA